MLKQIRDENKNETFRRFLICFISLKKWIFNLFKTVTFFFNIKGFEKTGFFNLFKDFLSSKAKKRFNEKFEYDWEKGWQTINKYKFLIEKRVSSDQQIQIETKSNCKKRCRQALQRLKSNQNFSYRGLLYNISGMIGHAEPILPRGDPNAEKPQPKLHLDAPIHDDNAVRQEIIAEEEEKETVEDETPSPLVEPNKLDHEKVIVVFNQFFDRELVKRS